jgi:O-antigen ligase
MARVLSLFNPVIAHPVARVGLALVLLAASVGSLSLVAYGDQYVNGGVTWGHDDEQIPLAQVNPMGVNLFLEKEPDRANIVKSLEITKDGGFKWLRQGFAWNDIEISGKGIFTDTRNPGVEVNAWDKYDFIVDQANKYGLEILARLDSPPVWARIPGDDVQAYPKGPPKDNNDFGDFAAAVAERYKGKIKYFQIWNEPNLIGEWGGHPVNAEEYTALLKVAHDRIKQVNPDAVIVTAALAPTAENTVRNENDVLYLEDMYRAGAAPYFDVLSTMLYSLGQPPDDRRVDLKRLNFSRPILLREVMQRNNDDKKPVWISEYAWISLPPDFKGDPSKNIWGKSVDEVTQGRYLVEGYERARSEWPWMGVMFVWHLRNPDGSPLEPATYFSILNQDFSPRPAYNALKEYSTQVPSVPTPQEKPFWNLVGFPLLYIIFGLLSLASAGYTAASLGRWASAALDRPRGRFSEQSREVARNAAAVLGMVLLFGLYYRAGSLPLIVAALGGWWLIALFKPSTGLAMTAFAIPFFWYPKMYGNQKFPIAETMLMLVFAAVLVRRAVLAFSPGLALRLRFVDAPVHGEPQGSDGTKDSLSESVPALALVKSEHTDLDPRATKPLPLGGQEDVQEEWLSPSNRGDELLPASWPTRPAIVFEKPALGAERKRTEDAEVRELSTLSPGSQQIGQAVSAVDRPLSTVAFSTPKLLWSRFLDWNAEDAFATPAVAILLLGTLSLLTMANPDFAPDSARAYRWVIIEPVLFYFLITDVIKGRRGLLRILDFFMLAAVGVAMYGLWQLVSGNGLLLVEDVSRVVSVYEHPNNLALYLGRAAPLAGCLAFFLPWGRRKALYALAVLPLGATLLLTFSRGAWVGVAIAMLVGVSVGLRWQWGWIRTQAPRRFRAWLGSVGVGIVLLAVAGLLLFPKLPERIFSPGSGVLRLTIWSSALRMGADHALFGVGLDQFLNQYQSGRQFPLGYGPCKVTDQGVVSTGSGDANECFTSHPHNIFLDYWLSLGIMGLIVLMWLLWRYYRESINLAKWAASKVGADPLARALALGLLASMTDFLVHGLVDNSYFLMDLALIFWMSCAMVQLLRKRLGIAAL